MKLSVSLPDDDVAYLDEYAANQGLDSRSAALRRAVRLLRAAELGPAYEDAWAEWSAGPDAADWDAVTGDGVESEPVESARVESERAESDGAVTRPGTDTGGGA